MSAPDTTVSPDPPVTLAPDTWDRSLAAGATILLPAVLIAVARGAAEWHRVPAIVWAHIGTIVVALALTPLMLLRRRGDTMHRRLGWLWTAAMLLTALLSFGVRGINGTGLSLIHLLSAWTLVQVILLVWYARRHQVARHRGAVRGMVMGALLVAGFFTFPFGRLMGRWLFG
jgi:uncharacterized membrane protein